MTESKVENVIEKTDRVKLIMHNNIEQTLNNCVKLENINDKSEELMKSAGVFFTNARKLKNKLWWKNMKCKFIIASIITIFIIIIACVLYFYTSNSNNTTTNT